MLGQSTLKLQKGIVIDSLFIPENKNGTYSIYLPKSFDLTRKWPILLGFSSKENARDLTKLFSNTAEELGYIVVVANFPEKFSNIKDRSSYISLFLNHIFSLFPIHERRVYALGIDDDAVLSSLLPAAYNTFNGVVAINNSYYYFFDEFVKLRKDFLYAGVIDYKNYRYRDFERIKKYLNRKLITADIYLYDEEISIPPEDVLTKVVTSFTLQDMLKGKIEMDTLWVKNQFDKDQMAIDSLVKEKSLVTAYEELRSMRKKYHLFFDISNLKEQQKKIRKTSEYRKERRLQVKYKNQELFLREQLRLSLEEDALLVQYKNLGWWQYKVDGFTKMMKTQEKYASTMAIRMSDFIKELVIGYKLENRVKGKIKEKEIEERKIFLNMLSTIVDPQDYESYKNVISLCAIDQDTATSLFYLEKMLKNGYSDLDGLYTIEGTLNLKISKEYNTLVKKYLGTSKYFSFIDP
ncbi:hypothetical protein GCM10022393_31770 [Aquimarina addita]|uniref:Uncharacterized protein n=1 Tax=Aquimarina addita TaxID=870485 RepID=A0ABP6URL2_9FLAO